MSPSRVSHPAVRYAALLLLAACAPDPGSVADATPPASEAGAARAVRTALAREEVWERTLRVNGELAAFEEATLSAKVPGRLEQLAVDLGARVARGDELAAVDTRDYELRLAQAEAAVEAARARLGSGLSDGDGSLQPENTAIVREARAALDDARRERERLVGLLRDGVAAQSAFDAAQARYEMAESRWHAALEEVDNRRAILAQRKAELELARQQFSDARLIAPFDGAVAARLAGTGDYLQVGDPVLRLVRFDPVRLRLEVPERSAADLRAGQSVRVRLEGGPSLAAQPGERHVETPIEGRISRLSPEIAERNRTLLVEAELSNPDGDLRPGSFARAEIVVDAQARALVVPAEALVRFAGIDKLFVVEAGVASERRIDVGRVAGGRVEVLSGLQAGEVVVLSPGGLQPGERVSGDR